MTLSPHRLLAFVVAAYDERDESPTPAAVADRFGTSTEAATAGLERLADCELLAQDDGGYRPKVTARELLELDVDGEFVVVDANADDPD